MNERIQIFDILKGFAIYLVVVGHVLVFGMGLGGDFGLFRLIGLTHMPLFFFISGWFTFKAIDGRLAGPRIGRRFMQLIVPMFVVGSVYYLRMPSSGIPLPVGYSYAGMWMSNLKYGYWFCITLFMIFLVYSVLCPVYRRIGLGKSGVIFSIGVFVVMLLLAKVLPPSISDALTLRLTAIYYVSFMAGVISRRHSKGFMRLLDNNVAMTVCIIVLACSAVLMMLGAAESLVVPVYHVALAPLAMKVFRPLGDNPGLRASRVLSYLGRNSLGIYLVHYLFIFPLPWIFPSSAIVPVAAVACTAAALIVACACIVIEIVRPSSTLSRLLTGQG